MKQHIRSSRSRYDLSSNVNRRIESSKQEISAPRRRLLELMQDVNFGRIEGLQVRDGEPVLDPMPTKLRLFLFGKDNKPNVSRVNDRFTLKKNVLELFEVFDRERSLSIQELMIDDGLPVRMIVADVDRI